jgi:hypothetical protein
VSSTYALITDDADYCHNIKVVNNTIKGDGTGVLGGPFKIAAVLINYAKGFTVANNFISGHKEGIQWWGGDGLSADEGAGSLAADRKCYDGTIIGNIVYNTVGGIWGAMGTRIVVNGNTVVGCKDVCIDFESCVDSSATGNTAADAANGALTVIGLSGNITFADNICTGSGSNNFYVIGGVYYTGTVGGLMNVSFINNTFRSTAGNTQAFVKVENCAFVTFHGNRFENVRLDTGTFSTALSQSQKITDNEFIFTKGGSFSFIALILLCARAGSYYAARPVVMWGVFLYSILATFISVDIISKGRNKLINTLLAFLTIILVYKGLTSDSILKQSINLNLSYTQAKAVSQNIIDNVVSTDLKNGTNMILYVPKGDDHDNWPFPIYEGQFIGRALKTYGIIKNEIYIEVKPDVSLNMKMSVPLN